MQEFIQQAAAKFGISSNQVEDATGGVLGLIKEHVANADFAELLNKVPGAQEINDRTDNFELDSEDQQSEGGGLLGSVIGAASSFLGGSGGGGTAGGIMGVLAGLQKSGLQIGQIDDFLGMLGGFLKGKAGSDLVNRIASQVPALKSLLG